MCREVSVVVAWRTEVREADKKEEGLTAHLKVRPFKNEGAAKNAYI